MLNRLNEEQKEALYLHFNQLVEDADNKKHLLSMYSDFIELAEKNVFSDVQLKKYTDKIVDKYLVI